MARSPDVEPENRWWSDIDLGFLLFLLIISVTAYGCDVADDRRQRRDVYMECARAKEMTEQCRIILSQK